MPAYTIKDLRSKEVILSTDDSPEAHRCYNSLRSRGNEVGLFWSQCETCGLVVGCSCGYGP